VVITHLRHQTALGKAQESLNHVRSSLDRQMPAECLALDLRAAMVAIGEIIGETTIDEVLDRIFQEFCIGK
jgi:tRNA modification GTPase